MKVSVDITPTISGHKVRGIGKYTEKLVNEFKEKNWGVEFNYFTNLTRVPNSDVVHFPYFDLFFRTLPSKTTSKTVVTIHDIIPLIFSNKFPSGLRGRINLFFQKNTLKNIDMVITDSFASKNDIFEKLSYPKEKIKVIHLGVDRTFKKIADQKLLENTRSKYKLPHKFALYVGDINWNKNILGLLEAVKLSKTNLVMVGKSVNENFTKESTEIKNFIQTNNLKDFIFFTGFIPESDLINVYNLATLTILPSFYEGFGLPVLESMACGTIVVCSNAASLEEISKEAIHCNPNDPSDIAKKLIYVYNMKSKELDEISLKSISFASNFTWEKTASQTVEIYKTLYASNHP